MTTNPAGERAKPHPRRSALFSPVAALTALLLAATTALAAAPPNVLLIITDDQGYPDLGCIGTKPVLTPTLDRLAAAPALAVRPELLLLDEPFSSLDWRLKGRLLDELKPWCAELGTTLVLVTHDPAEARALCEDAVVLDGASVVEQRSLEALLPSPTSPFLQECVRRSGVRCGPATP
jgi:ABC-type protease/lipase transport system fused ATPase/permease subunit